MKKKEIFRHIMRQSKKKDMPQKSKKLTIEAPKLISLYIFPKFYKKCLQLIFCKYIVVLKARKNFLKLLLILLYLSLIMAILIVLSLSQVKNFAMFLKHKFKNIERKMYGI